MENQLSPEAVKLVEKALAELKNRGVIHDHCPRCETFDWGVEPVAVSVMPLTNSSALPLYAYSSRAHTSLLQITCKKCGYTMFHNLKTIGL
jgi:ribosomal protein S27AE